MYQQLSVEEVEIQSSPVYFDLQNVEFTEQDFSGSTSFEESEETSLPRRESREEDTCHGVRPFVEHSYAGFYRHEEHSTNATDGWPETSGYDSLRHEVNGGFGDPAIEDTGDGPTALLPGKADGTCCVTHERIIRLVTEMGDISSTLTRVYHRIIGLPHSEWSKSIPGIRERLGRYRGDSIELV